MLQLEVNPRLHVHEHLGGCSYAWHADAALGVCSPVARGIRLDEFALGGAFEFRLLGVEVLECVGGTVGFPEEHVVEVHVAGELCAVEVDADGVHLGRIFESEFAFAVAEFNLVVLEGAEVFDVTEALSTRMRSNITTAGKIRWCVSLPR